MSSQDFKGVSLADYVIQEAKEKSFEIEIKTLKQFEKEKKSIVSVVKDKIKEEYEQKIKEKEMERKILHSTLVNKFRVQKMESRNKAMLKCFGAAQYQTLQKISSDKQFYKKLLTELILEGLIKLMENFVFVRVLKRDESLVEEILESAKSEFVKKVKHELGEDFDLELRVDKQNYLDERVLKDNTKVDVSEYGNIENEVIDKTNDLQKCFGGVHLTNRERTIVCKNTLDVRSDLCYQDSLPVLRNVLFPKE